jgi:thioredoxin-related protein
MQSLYKLLIFFFLPIFCLGQHETANFFNEQDKNIVNWTTLDNAEYLSKHDNKYMLLFFYRDGCEYCDKMKNETFTDSLVVSLINNNFLPVMINGKSKKPIIYNDSIFLNDKPNVEDPPFFHNLFKHLVDLRNENYYWPTIVIVDASHNKIIQGSGFWPKELALRNLEYLLLEQ